MATTPTQARLATGGVPWNQDAESLFRMKPISEIRNVEATTRKQIQEKSEELRQLVGNRYRDLIDSADSIVAMKSTGESIAANISSIHNSILYSLSSSDVPRSPHDSLKPVGAHDYGIACRVKYLVDTPENIWGCLDESMFLESSARYIRAKHVHFNLLNSREKKNIQSTFPLLQHQWQIVEGFKVQISQRGRERLLDQSGDLGIRAFADALAAIAIIDELTPNQVLTLFIDSRKSIMSQKLSSCCRDANADGSEVISVFCYILRIIQITICQVGELFLQVLNDMPLFYKTVLDTPPASQLFGGIPNPDEEVKLWNLFKEKLESSMILLGRDFISSTCSDWLRNCGKEITSKINGCYLIDVIGSGYDLSLAEKLIRETMDGKQVLEGSLEWLKSVFGSEIELPWKRTRELVLGEDSDIWDDIFEHAFVQRMKGIIDLRFTELNGDVNVVESVRAIAKPSTDHADSLDYLNKFQNGGGVWFMTPNGRKPGSTPSSKSHQPQESDFHSCLSTYFGPEVSRIKVAVDNCCQNVLQDLLSFLESPNAHHRLKDLSPYVQNKCYESLSSILMQLKNELDCLYGDLENKNKDDASKHSPAILVERSLFIGRLLFAFQKHAKHIPVILGSPRSWIGEVMTAVSSPSPIGLKHARVATDSEVIDSPGRRTPDSSRKQTSLVASALFGTDDKSSSQLQELRQTNQDLCIRAYNLWISWVSDELATIFSRNLDGDDALSSNAPVRGWEDTVVKQQEQSTESQSEMRISLPSMPSLYVTSILFYACEEVHRVGGHVLDKQILQNFAKRLFDKVVRIYEDFLLAEEGHGSQVSEKGVLQVLFDLKFAADILSGGYLNPNEGLSETAKTPFRRKQRAPQPNSVVSEHTKQLVNRLSQRLDPIDWLTYEPYLWENERQAYLRHAVLFGFFVQLNRMHMDTVQKLPTNSESNIMRCSTVPRFKYLPISAPALSARNAVRTSASTSTDDVYSRNSWKSFTNDDITRKSDVEDDSSLGVAAPFLKSFMQVGSRFGESIRLGSILTDGQVGRFGDMLPAQAAGLLSSFTAGRSDS
ncbi:conserved oligomeric Golgi complex subunit 1 [Salvia hispanica]|uniref:conserved oligomeric Golgi complex subunit 1 n=1 Tax=Salvia hispanica TaxID=49212 RepID=UPI0020090012|nr:conserved oligomeric Golgi complex subunit 1 [Salvia hispanica]XP_047980526.1 conserved oligomeric Golgi complex subunit 1 [Salvia hispanica]XP_047980527.1 conserved oligomeric Golgi complex subunit 1 [Salvia hispanica]